MKGSFVFFVLFFAAAYAKVSYEGYQVWRINFSSKEQLDGLNKIASEFNLDVLAEFRDRRDILIAPRHSKPVGSLLMRYGLTYTTQIQNLQRLIEEQDKKLQRNLRYDPNTYNDWDTINAYLTEVAANNPALVRRVVLGTTLEGRELVQLRFAEDPSKKVIWIDCGIHAREHITPATCLYGIDRMIEGGDADFEELLANYEVWILPVTNPDGYAYTFTNDRMWRKNRNPNDGGSCAGVDLNRNFDAGWSGPGASDLLCSQTYYGTSAASELETQAVQNAMTASDASGRISVLHSIHSYSQLWMFPYGYTNDHPADYDELMANSKIGVDALTAMYGTNFEYGPIADTIYVASGGTVDYAYDTAGIIYSYTLELRDKGQFGFLLPESQIIPTGEETWAGIIAAIRQII